MTTPTLSPPSPPSTTPSRSPSKNAGGGKGWWWLLLACPLSVVLVPILFIIVLAGGNGGDGNGQCSTSPVLGLAPSGGAPVSGLNPKQTQIAATIVGHVVAKKLPVKAAVAGVATAWDESTLRNLNNPAVPESMSLPNDGTGYDGGSIGIMQQQPSMGWGTPKELMNPGIATDKFLDALVKVPNWETMDVADAIAAVQKNAAGAVVYQPFVEKAKPVVQALQDSPEAASLVDESGGDGGAGCTAGAGDDGGGEIPGFVKGGPAGPNAVAAAAAHMGVRYSWGGGDLNGPTKGIHDGGVADSFRDYAIPGFDCSGLSRYAIHKATGKVIPRTSQDQSVGGQPVPDQAHAKAGDLVFFGGEGSAHHVGIYMGADKMINAPESGAKVRVDKVSTFGEPPTFRRYT